MKENMFYGASPAIFKKAEELRTTMTSAERFLWQALQVNEWNLKFRRQHPIAHYIADFYCHAIKLVIEVDGDIHNTDEAKQYDAARENELKNLGITVLRFKNDEIFKNKKAVLQKIDETVRVLQNSPLGDGGLYIIKIGGNIIDDEAKLAAFLKDFATIKGKKILVHGGGKLATRLAEQMQVPQQMVEGRRITDAETLKIVTMVYAGYINKNIVAQLQANGCNAIGLCGADGNSIQAHKRIHPTLDYGYVGDVDNINTALFESLLNDDMAVVVAPITHNKEGQLLNTNADTIAQEIAKALSDIYNVSLIYSFEKSGVLLDANDDNSVIKEINPPYYQELKEKGAIFAGMIPKLDNAFAALNSGVKKVIIGKAEVLQQLINGTAGTTIRSQAPLPPKGGTSHAQPSLSDETNIYATALTNWVSAAAQIPPSGCGGAALLKQLIATPSFSKEEQDTATIIETFLQSNGVKAERYLNNIWATNQYYDAAKPTILLNSHHDTVKPNKGYTLDPFTPVEKDGKLYGLGSNDAGGCLVSLIATFLHFYPQQNLNYNIVLAATAEEEISGKNGIEALLPLLPEIDFAVVGEPTQMQMAVAERGLMVLDCTAYGRAGHAARNEGENAITKAMKDMAWLNSYAFEKVSELLGPVKMNVTVIETDNKAHNVVPAECRFVVDVRVNELYTFEEVLDIVKTHMQSEVQPRSMRLRSSMIPLDHPLVKAGLQLGRTYYGSPTTSDKALMPFPALKIGPGDSARSHTADEYIYTKEIEDGIELYIQLLKQIV